jgi:hypothetical protein
MAFIYDPRYHTWDSWASLMCESYASQSLSIPDSEDNWQQWAAGLKALDGFNNEGIPGPYVFSNWQDWAVAVLNATNSAQS